MWDGFTEVKMLICLRNFGLGDFKRLEELRRKVWRAEANPVCQKERISAKKGLQSYCFNMKTTLDDDKVKDKISEDDKKAINDKCDEAIKWLDANQLAEVEEFNEKQKEVEGVCNPIITKLYADAGGAPGGMPGGRHHWLVIDHAHEL